jgi:anti-anti-sigma regulatory factor
MMLAAPAPAVPSPPRSLGIRTALADRTRAVVQVSRDLDAEGVAALERLIDEHCTAGRCFLRISVIGVHHLSAAFIALLERTHYRLLASRGTSIITGAGPEVMAALRGLGLDEVLLVVERSADEIEGARPPAAS